MKDDTAPAADSADQLEHAKIAPVLLMHGSLLLVQVALYAVALLPCVPLTLAFVSLAGLWLGLAVGIAISFHLASFIVIFGAAVLGRLLAGKPAPGNYAMDSKEARRWLSNIAFCEIARRSPFFGYFHHYTPLACLFYRILGARIAWDVSLGNGARITDPWLVRIESRATLGDCAHVVSHFVQGGRIILSEVAIGAGATVGGLSIVSPGCRIGRGATLGAGFLSDKGTADTR